MYPYLWVQQTEHGQLEYGTYGLMLVMAFLICAIVCGMRMKKVGINPDIVVPMLVVAIVSSIIGARLLHFLGSPGDRELFFSNPLVLLNVTKGGMAVLGGLIGGSVCGALFMKWRGVDVWKAADIAATVIPIGTGIGRMGCFFAGCCHGRVIEGVTHTSITGGFFPGGEIVSLDAFPFVAFTYVRGVGMGSVHDIPVYPTQLWEIVIWFSLCGVLSWVWLHKRKFDGQIMAMLMVAYPVLRSFVELFRGDAVRGTGYLGELSTSQVASIPVFVAAIIIVVVQYRKGVKPEAEFVRAETGDVLDYDE
jgi:phosphatidylglycerol---prolipoprotein diacylglyceryl transferase